jgi:hypothetical protein
MLALLHTQVADTAGHRLAGWQVAAGNIATDRSLAESKTELAVGCYIEMCSDSSPRHMMMNLGRKMNNFGLNCIPAERNIHLAAVSNPVAGRRILLAVGNSPVVESQQRNLGLLLWQLVRLTLALLQPETAFPSKWL